MKQEPLNIENFEIGDIIVRIKPAKMLGKNGIEDRSYLGKPFKFLGIANGCIYIEKVKQENEIEDMPDVLNLAEMMSMFFGETGPRALPTDLWEEGWAIYINPYDIGKTGDEFADEFKILERASLRDLKAKYSKALKNEEYEKAEKIKKIIDNR